MSLTKRLIDEFEATEEMNNWIEDYVDIGVKEGSPEWEEGKAAYIAHVEAQDKIWDDEQFVNDVFFLNEFGNAFSVFNSQMNIIKAELPNDPPDYLIKMTYSYVVTLMETCLGDMIKRVVLSDERFLANAISKVKELNEEKYTLSTIHATQDFVKKSAVKWLSNQVYHNVNKTVYIYSAILGQNVPETVNSKKGELNKIVNIRHHIVHRNGIDLEGKEVNIGITELLSSMENVHSFVQAMYTFLLYRDNPH